MSKWNYDSCYNEAKKYKHKIDFAKKNQTAYTVARKNGWLNDYTWFVRPTVHNKKWYYESCYNEAKKYNGRTEFNNNCPSAYNVALKNGWLSDYMWFESKAKPFGYWNEQTCYEEAQKYKTLRDFRQNAPRAYYVAWKNGWASSYNWFIKNGVPETNCYIVYSYQDAENKTIYVGLTNTPKNRHRQHTQGITIHGQTQYSPVYVYFMSIGVDIPAPIILKQNLYAKEAQYWEEYYVNHFKNEGWNLLNKAKPGALGSLSDWTYEKCYNEAKKYKTRTEFRKNRYSAYIMAFKNGWIDDYLWFITKQKPSGYWTYEKCYNEAKKYSYYTEFRRNNKAAASAACHKGWMKDYTWFTRPEPCDKKWNYDACYNEAKKYKSKSDFKHNAESAYNAALKNKWMNEYTWFKRPNSYKRKWVYETCYKEAKKYNSKSDFRKGTNRAYEVARENGWLNDYIWFN